MTTHEEILRTWQEHLTEQEQGRREAERTAAAAERAALRLMKCEEAPAMSYEEIAVNALNLYRLELAIIHGSGGRKGKIKTAARKKAIRIIARTPTSAAAEATAAALDGLTELTAVIQRAQERERLATFPLAHKQAAEAVKTKILER